jgi:predicted dehydrogenase
MPEPVRIGVVGTGRVVASGLIQPAKSTPGARIVAVASRAIDKARAFAALHGIDQAYGAYDDLLQDANVEAVYIALPTALHAYWVRKALDAGKHVLCEKPLAPNAQVAESLVAHARLRQRVLQEGMHTWYMQRLRRQRDLVASGELGSLTRIDSCFRVPRIPMARGDFRLNFALGGGAALDLGCYAASCLRYVAGEEGEVTRVRYRLASPEVDRWMRAELRLASGARGTCECGFRGWYSLRVDVRVQCESGWVRWDKAGLMYKRDGEVIREPIQEDWTYQRQLDAFVRSSRGEGSHGPSPDDSVATARMIDAMYVKANLALRQPIDRA